MFLLGTPVELRWEILPTESPPSFDLVVKTPSNTISYQGPIADYTPPTSEDSGLILYTITPEIEGLWSIELVVGVSDSYERISEFSLFVFSATDTLAGSTAKRTSRGSFSSTIEIPTSLSMALVSSSDGFSRNPPPLVAKPYLDTQSVDSVVVLVDVENIHRVQLTDKAKSHIVQDSLRNTIFSSSAKNIQKTTPATGHPPFVVQNSLNNTILSGNVKNIQRTTP